jgi:glycosyltransferase involved in cell wall biosynthesis
MKILLLITKGEIGGAQVFVANLAKGLENNFKPKDQIEIACGEGDFLFDFAQKEDIKIHKIKSLKRSSGLFSNIKFFFSFVRFVKRNKFDVVHLNSSNTLIGAISAKIVSRRIKTVFTVHGLSILDPNHQASLLKKFVYRMFFKFCFLFIDRVVFVSQNNLDLAKSRKLVKEGYLIYNGVEPNYLNREASRSFLFNKIGILDEGQFLIGSIGRLAYPKNYEFLIENFSDILQVKPNAKLVLIGDGPERSKYEGIIESKGLRGFVFVLGEIPGATRYLKGLDLFVLPSIYEGLSISLIDAFLAEVKTIASKVGGNPEIIGDDFCYNLNDIDDFLSIFKMVIFDNGIFINKERELFIAENMVNNYLSLYRN